MRVIVLLCLLVLAAIRAQARDLEQTNSAISISSTSNEANLDSNRAPTEFSFQTIRTGGTNYMDSFELQTFVEQTIGSFSAKSAIDMTMTTQSSVTNLGEGGQRVNATITGILVHIGSSSGENNSSMTTMSINCDFSINVQEKTVPIECVPYVMLLGGRMSFVVDDEGAVADVVNNTEGLTTMSPPKSIETTARLMKLLPTVPTSPGESHSLNVHLDDYLGEFNGTTTLKGYKIYEGHEVAIFVVQGKLSLDVSSILGKQSPASQSMGIKATMAQVPISAYMYWDNAVKLVRKSQTNITTTIDLYNPNDDSHVKTSFKEIISTVTSIQ